MRKRSQPGGVPPKARWTASSRLTTVNGFSTSDSFAESGSGTNPAPPVNADINSTGMSGRRRRARAASLRSGGMRHDHIGQDQIKPIRIRGEDLFRRQPVRRGRDEESGMFKGQDHECTHSLIVLCHEYRANAHARRGRMRVRATIRDRWACRIDRHLTPRRLRGCPLILKRERAKCSD